MVTGGYPTGIPCHVAGGHPTPVIGTDWEPGLLRGRDPIGSGAGAAGRSPPAPPGAAPDLEVSKASEESVYLREKQSQRWKK